MSYKFKCHTDGEREFFQWECDSRLFATKRPIKKDFEFSQSLLDFLDLKMDNRFDFFNGMGKDIQRLCAKQDEDGNVRFLRDCFNKLAKEHIYFEFLRFDWFDRLTKYLERDYTCASDLMPYKQITHIPMNIITWQNQLKLIFIKVLETTPREKTVGKGMADLYGGKIDNPLDLFDFRQLSTGFERIDSYTFAEVLRPKNMGDMVDFFLREIVRREVTFKVCKSCGKYFSSTSHGNSEYCNRIVPSEGKTCKDIGSLKTYRDKVAQNPAIQAYNRAYKTRFSRIKYKRMSKEAFQTWAEIARDLRDKVIAGEWKLEDFEAWLKK